MVTKIGMPCQRSFVAGHPIVLLFYIGYLSYGYLIPVYFEIERFRTAFGGNQCYLISIYSISVVYD